MGGATHQSHFQDGEAEVDCGVLGDDSEGSSDFFAGEVRDILTIEFHGARLGR